MLYFLSANGDKDPNQPFRDVEFYAILRPELTEKGK
jgi:hypothetical protein